MQLGHAASYASGNLGVVGGKLKVHGGAAAVVIGAKAGTLKQRVKEGQYGTRIQSFF